MVDANNSTVADDDINYHYLVQAIDYYREKGYRLIQVPWLISAEADEITRPAVKRPLETFLGRLPASAETSFLDLILQGKLPPGRYQAITPCFRDEPVLDEIHKYWFMKVELIDTLNCDAEALLRDALSFFSRYLPCAIENFEDGSQDIVSQPDSIELGSYGVRTRQSVGSWAYGTGLAEPRMSYCIKQLKATKV